MATMAYTLPPGAKRAEPHVPVGHPDFKWTAGADVQSTWRRFGWTPPSEQRAAPPEKEAQ